jgi:hypothetical protein
MSNPEKHPSIQDWHNVPEEEFFLYARAFRAAAKKMALAVELAPGPSAKFAACPVVFMYRRALELHLKALILGDGGNFWRRNPTGCRSIEPTPYLGYHSSFARS